MKKLFKRIVSVALTASMCFSGSIVNTVNAEELTEEVKITNTQSSGEISGAVDQRGNYALYDNEYWNRNQGTISIDFYSRGAYDCEWKDVEDCLFMTGEVLVSKRKDEQQNDVYEFTRPIGNPIISYRAVSETDENSNYFFGGYGYFVDSSCKCVAEYFIIDDWGAYKPCSDLEPVAEKEIDGAVYDIYSDPFIQESIITPVIMNRYFSVRREKRSSESNILEGKISVNAHFKAWKDCGFDLADIYEIMLATEGFNSSGKFHVLRNDLYYLDETPEYEFPEGMDYTDYFEETAETKFNDSASGIKNGYYYNVSRFKMFGSESDDDEIFMETLQGGNFRCSWNSHENCSFERGLQYYNSENMTKYPRYYNGEELTLEYSAEYKPEGSSVAGVSGWCNTNKYNFFIVDAYKDWSVPETASFLGSVSIEDGIYDMYTEEGFFYNKIWSVRRENKLVSGSVIEGTVPVSKHFYAWTKYGLGVIDPDCVKFAVAGYGSAGTAEVTKNIVKIDGEDIYMDYTADSPEVNALKPQPVHNIIPDTDDEDTEVYIPGDLNGDMQVNSFDLIIGRREVIKSMHGEEVLEASDVDCSGKTKINDLVLLTKLVLGDEVVVPKARPKR